VSASTILKESEACIMLGWGIIVLCFLVGLIFIFTFGRVEIPNAYYGSRLVWSGTMISIGVGIMFNGFLLGYLFQKIGSILRYHEDKNLDKVN